MNRLLMLRARGLSGPFFQKIGSNLWAHANGFMSGLRDKKPWYGTEPYCCMDFSQATIEPSAPNPNGVTAQFLRASEATVVDYEGNLVTVPADVPRFPGARWDGSQWHATKPEGAPIHGITYLNEPAATNYFRNSDIPVTQTITGLSGDHTFWLAGSGSMTLSGGATGVVTEGNPVTASVSGDVLCTISGTVERAQVEGGTFPTSYIPTAGAPVTREEDDLRYTPTARTAAISYGFTAIPLAETANVFATYDVTSANYALGANILESTSDWSRNDTFRGWIAQFRWPDSIGISRSYAISARSEDKLLMVSGSKSKEASIGIFSGHTRNNALLIGRVRNGLYPAEYPILIENFMIWDVQLSDAETKLLGSKSWSCPGA